MIPLLIAALFVVIGVGFLGGALFGRIRQRRFNLLGLAAVLWLGAALLFTSCSPPANPSQATTTPTTDAQATEAQNTPTPAPSPTPLPSPTPTSTP
ncbi:MAG TPA: hypothetical protein G4N94_09345, partial [Caldilineae bacterium]|nr:hypothetical protein [Caldilineae bacterium]